ncbi:hypothetical protein HYV79_03880 [Candidatus Woesearchaeota archaeon]|nr:hypothetical protein [Candidatus Woesearchaeota archaeon]
MVKLPKKDVVNILPHDEILRIREELKHLREHEIPPAKLQVTMQDLSKKIDNLIDIFEDAMKSVKEEEGGITLKEQLEPVMDKLQEVLDQNSKIADGIVAIAEMLQEGKKPSFLPPKPFIPKLSELPLEGPRIPPPPGIRPEILQKPKKKGLFK